MPDSGIGRNSTPRIVILDEVDSTNAEAMRRALAGETGPLWVRANIQTRGRGRSGRSWSSPRGNLYATYLFAPQCSPAFVHQLSLLAGLAVHDTISAAAPGMAGLRLKWPNDALLGRAKMAGVLAESITGEGAMPLAMVGIGINLVSAPPDAGRLATHLAAHGPTLDPDAALSALAGAISRWLGAWDRGNGFAIIRAAWLERAGPKGERLAVNAGAERIEGFFAGLHTDGSLLLCDSEGRERRFSFGDVTAMTGLAGA